MKRLLQRWDAWGARRVERSALRVLGESLPPSAEIQVIDERLASLDRFLAVSLARDRADYANVPRWAKPLVVARGVFDRAVLRALKHRARRDRAEACARHGEASLQSSRGAVADDARFAAARAREAEQALQPLPAVVREVRHLSGFVWKEARGQLVPRLPALAGLAVGFWIAQTFTDSPFSATLHSWGIGQGPRHAVGSGTLRAMSFWLPLLAAALSSYAGSRLAAFVRSRYSPPPDAGVPGEQLR